MPCRYRYLGWPRMSEVSTRLSLAMPYRARSSLDRSTTGGIMPMIVEPRPRESAASMAWWHTRWPLSSYDAAPAACVEDHQCRCAVHVSVGPVPPVVLVGMGRDLYHVVPQLAVGLGPGREAEERTTDGVGEGFDQTVVVVDQGFKQELQLVGLIDDHHLGRVGRETHRRGGRGQEDLVDVLSRDLLIFEQSDAATGPQELVELVEVYRWSLKAFEILVGHGLQAQRLGGADRNTLSAADAELSAAFHRGGDPVHHFDDSMRTDLRTQSVAVAGFAIDEMQLLDHLNLDSRLVIGFPKKWHVETLFHWFRRWPPRS